MELIRASIYNLWDTEVNAHHQVFLLCARGVGGRAGLVGILEV